MRIIKGRDYYDGAGHGIDPDIRFVRDRRELVGARSTSRRLRAPPRPAQRRHADLLRAGRRRRGHPGRHPPRGAGAGLGGRLRTIHYAREAVAVLLATWSREVRWRYWRPWHASDADAFMTRRGEGPWTRWLAEHRVVTGVIEGVRHRHTLPATPPPAPTLVANTDNLEDYEAYRALDPATAHMRIANWVGGVLPSAPETSRFERPHPQGRLRPPDLVPQAARPCAPRPRRPPLLARPAAPGS